MISMMMTSMNMATMMAEDAGTVELRNPLNSGMRSKNKGIIHKIYVHIFERTKRAATLALDLD